MGKILLFISILTLGSCGFSPMYGTINNDNKQSTEDLLRKIYISTIPDREGQFLRNELIDNFNNTGINNEYTYTLHTDKIDEKETELDITKSSDATRMQLKISTTINLKHNLTGEIIFSRKLHSITSYNILSSQFTTKASEEYARNNALKDIARQIETQIALFLKG